MFALKKLKKKMYECFFFNLFTLTRVCFQKIKEENI